MTFSPRHFQRILIAISAYNLASIAVLVLLVTHLTGYAHAFTFESHEADPFFHTWPFDAYAAKSFIAFCAVVGAISAMFIPHFVDDIHLWMPDGTKSPITKNPFMCVDLVLCAAMMLSGTNLAAILLPLLWVFLQLMALSTLPPLWIGVALTGTVMTAGCCICAVRQVGRQAGL